MNYSWCSKCKVLFTTDKRHEEHDTSVIGKDSDNTVLCLDEIIEYGLGSLQQMESEAENARKIKKDIEEMKEKFTKNLRQRIELIVKDLRVALDTQAMVLMGDVEKKVVQMEAQAQAVIKKSTVKLDTAKQFIQKAAIVLPDEEGKFSQDQIKDLYNFYKSVEKINLMHDAEVQEVVVNIKHPNSMKIKTECANLAQRVIGEIEDNDRPMLLNPRRPSIDITHVNNFGVEDKMKPQVAVNQGKKIRK